LKIILKKQEIKRREEEVEITSKFRYGIQEKP